MRDRVIGWVVMPIACWAALAATIWLVVCHPMTAVRIAYGLGIPATVGLMLIRYQEYKDSSRVLEAMLAGLCFVAIFDLGGM